MSGPSIEEFVETVLPTSNINCGRHLKSRWYWRSSRRRNSLSI